MYPPQLPMGEPPAGAGRLSQPSDGSRRLALKTSLLLILSNVLNALRPSRHSRRPGPAPEAAPLDSASPLALALSLSRPFGQGGKESVREGCSDGVVVNSLKPICLRFQHGPIEIVFFGVRPIAWKFNMEKTAK